MFLSVGPIRGLALSFPALAHFFRLLAEHPSLSTSALGIRVDLRVTVFGINIAGGFVRSSKLAFRSLCSARTDRLRGPGGLTLDQTRLKD